MKRHTKNHSERGTAILEFALTAAFFFMMLVAVVSGGHLFWTHNAMVESTRRGARYAATQCKPNLAGCPGSAGTMDRVKNVVLYGTTTAGSSPLVYNLTPANITVTYSADYGVAAGTVSVKIVNYKSTFAIATDLINMPPYQTTVVGENAGFIPGASCPN